MLKFPTIKQLRSDLKVVIRCSIFVKKENPKWHHEMWAVLEMFTHSLHKVLLWAIVEELFCILNFSIYLIHKH